MLTLYSSWINFSLSLFFLHLSTLYKITKCKLLATFLRISVTLIYCIVLKNQRFVLQYVRRYLVSNYVFCNFAFTFATAIRLSIIQIWSLTGTYLNTIYRSLQTRGSWYVLPCIQWWVSFTDNYFCFKLYLWKSINDNFSFSLHGQRFPCRWTDALKLQGVYEFLSFI